MCINSLLWPSEKKNGCRATGSGLGQSLSNGVNRGRWNGLSHFGPWPSRPSRAPDSSSITCASRWPRVTVLTERGLGRLKGAFLHYDQTRAIRQTLICVHICSAQHWGEFLSKIFEPTEKFIPTRKLTLSSVWAYVPTRKAGANLHLGGLKKLVPTRVKKLPSGDQTYIHTYIHLYLCT
jgi:hypothetical protein